jgi:hypothetical protein
MRKNLSMILASTAAAIFVAPAIALADDPPPATSGPDDAQPAEPEETPDKTAPPNDGTLPPPESDSDPQPEVAGPMVPPGGLVTQAGVGGPTGYGRAGVLELGGSAGLTLASDLRQINISPSIGWFVADNLQISAILGVSHVGTSEDSTTLYSALAEPSYHLPFNRSMFGFLGMGIGGSYVDSLGGGLAVAPRLGANFLVGRSGVLTPSLSWQYTTHDIGDVSIEEQQQLTVSSALRANIGYTVMW